MINRVLYLITFQASRPETRVAGTDTSTAKVETSNRVVNGTSGNAAAMLASAGVIVPIPICTKKTDKTAIFKNVLFFMITSKLFSVIFN